jgi:hypothetical protein
MTVQPEEARVRARNVTVGDYLTEWSDNEEWSRPAFHAAREMLLSRCCDYTTNTVGLLVVRYEPGCGCGGAL